MIKGERLKAKKRFLVLITGYLSNIIICVLGFFIIDNFQISLWFFISISIFVCIIVAFYLNSFLFQRTVSNIIKAIESTRKKSGNRIASSYIANERLSGPNALSRKIEGLNA